MSTGFYGDFGMNGYVFYAVLERALCLRGGTE